MGDPPCPLWSGKLSKEFFSTLGKLLKKHKKKQSKTITQTTTFCSGLAFSYKFRINSRKILSLFSTRASRSRSLKVVVVVLVVVVVVVVVLLVVVVTFCKKCRNHY